MSRIVRMSLALLFALMMVIATASAALAFNPPNNVENGVGANSLCAPGTFPAWGIGVGADEDGNLLGPGGLGPWNATKGGPGTNAGPLDTSFVADTNECVPDPR